MASVGEAAGLCAIVVPPGVNGSAVLTNPPPPLAKVGPAGAWGMSDLLSGRTGVTFPPGKDGWGIPCEGSP
jgi:hypothetical protein